MDIRGTWSRRLALPVCAAALGLLWLWGGSSADPAGQGLRAAAVAAQATPQLADAPSRLAAVAPAAGAEPGRDLPPGVTRAQWDALQAELRSRPDGAAELKRLGGYLAWSDTLRHFRAARSEGADPAELMRLARVVDDGLAERLHRAEVSAGEARQIKSAVLAVTVPDEKQRAAQLREWAAAEFAPAKADPRQPAFQDRQAAIVAAWSAQPPAARSRAALERELDALREQSFATSGR